MTTDVLLNPFSPLRYVRFRTLLPRTSGGGGAPTDQTVTQTNLPEYVRPQFERALARAEAQSLAPYTPYSGQRLAQPGADIGLSYDMTRNVATSGVPGLPQAAGVVAQNIGQGQQIAQGAGQPFQFAPSQFSQFSPTAFAGFEGQQVDPFAGFSAGRAQPFGGFQAQQVDPFAEFREQGADPYQYDPTQLFTGANVGQYMSPYMQQVLDVQKEQARRQFEEQGAGRAAQAVQAGAFGGSRQGVQEAIAERELLNRMADIQATGQQQAFESAQQAFGADRAALFGREQSQAAELARAQGIGVSEAARVQGARAAELARTQGISVEEARRVQAGQAAEQARVQGLDIQEQARIQESQARELARTQGISVEEARRIQAGQAAELGRVQGIGASELGRVQGAQASELGRVQAAQAAEDRAARAQQLEALGFSSQQAQQMVGMGETARAADIQGAQLLEAVGRAERGFEQEGLDIAYQDFIRQQAYPEQQLQLFSSILRGVPVQPGVTTTAYAPYNPAQQALGAGITGIGLYRGLTG